jgi:hypothetical protein
MATTTCANRSGLRTVVLLAVLALPSFGGSPALALSITGVTTSPGGTIVVQDPCAPGPQIVGFTATPSAIAFGENSTLNWNVQVPGGCRYAILVAGQAAALQGSLKVTPASGAFMASDSIATYKMVVAWGSNLEHSASVTTDIAVTLPSNNQFTFTTPWVAMFIRALATPNAIVVIDNSVEMDLSGLATSEPILIASGVQLSGGRTAVAGKPYQPGPRLFTTTIPPILFQVDGPGVRISGLRIQGHLTIDPPQIADDGDGSSAIYVPWKARGPAPIEIDHNEIFGWSDSAVWVAGAPTATNTAIESTFDATTGLLTYYSATPEQAYIHDNYIHHNLHQGKLGYGVNVGGQGAHVLVERNVFDWNRHAIAGGGSLLSGYRAYRNLVFANGYQAGFVDWQFDMHGDGSLCLSNPVVGDRECGTAGHDMDIQYNSFMFTHGPAIKVRGTPTLAAVINSNVFAHVSLFDTVDQYGQFILGAVDFNGDGVWDRDNTIGVTQWWANNTCDFDGDGVNDFFLTTGQTWWYSSGGTGPWVYLNTSTLTLDRGEVTVGYFDGDNLCDVSAGGVTYSDGMPQGPQRLGPRPIPAKARLLLNQ